MKFIIKIYFWSSGKIWKGLHNVIIQSFNRGYTPDIGCVIFEFVSHTLLVGGLTSTKYKVNAREVSNNKSVWDKNVVSNLDGHGTITLCLTQKAMEWCEVNERVTWNKEMMHCKICKIFSSRLTKQAYCIWGEKWLTIINEEHGDHWVQSQLTR